MFREKAGFIAVISLIALAVVILIIAALTNPGGGASPDGDNKDIAGFGAGDSPDAGDAGGADVAGTGAGGNGTAAGSANGADNSAGSGAGGNGSSGNGSGDPDTGGGSSDNNGNGNSSGSTPDTGIPGDEPGAGENFVYGTVTGADELPVEGALLSAYSYRKMAPVASVRTDETGAYKIVTGKPDNLIITVVARGYPPVRKREVKSPGQADFALVKGKRLEGTVFS